MAIYAVPIHARRGTQKFVDTESKIIESIKSLIDATKIVTSSGSFGNYDGKHRNFRDYYSWERKINYNITKCMSYVLYEGTVAVPGSVLVHDRTSDVNLYFAEEIIVYADTVDDAPEVHLEGAIRDFFSNGTPITHFEEMLTLSAASNYARLVREVPDVYTWQDRQDTVNGLYNTVNDVADFRSVHVTGWSVLTVENTYIGHNSMKYDPDKGLVFVYHMSR